MSRQKGYVFRAGEFWWLRYFESTLEKGKVVRRQKAKKLTKLLYEHRRLKRPPEDGEQLQKEFLSSVNHNDAAPDKSLSLAELFPTGFVPHMAGRRKVSTCYCQKKNWEKQLAPRVGDLRVRDFTTVDA